MTQVIADRRDIDFVLHEQLQVSDLSRYERFSEFTKKVVDMIVTEARTLAIKELLPTWKTGDVEGCRFEKGAVFSPPGFVRAWRLLAEGEWFAPGAPIQWGGQGMPETLAIVARDYLTGGNFPLMNVVGLNHGAGRLIEHFGTLRQKELYLRKVYAGQWGGTMVLTEPECGSDLSGLSTTAVKNADGTYNLSGNKVFISGGEYDTAENIIHPVLARIEGAPAGSRGISLFIVPKIWVEDDGSLGAPNDIVCTGIEEKMGLHGSPTCTMALGGKGNCRGVLLGEENRGLAQMFLMMNEARLMVGSQGLACASAAYLYALDFARTRIQGPRLGAKDKTPVTIIHHPDIRRMLLSMKMYVEAMRSLLWYIAYCEDRKAVAVDDAEKERFQDLIDVLIPVGKGYVTDRSVDVCSLAVQVFGGYGYVREYPVEQLFRDVRVTPIYEGTNGIQAMDLLGRKLRMKNGRAFGLLLEEIRETAHRAKALQRTAVLADALLSAAQKLKETGDVLSGAAAGPEMATAYAHACPFLDVAGDVVMAWMLTWRAVIAAERLSAGAQKKDAAFYEGQLASAENFVRTVLPVTVGRMAAVGDLCGAAVSMADASFG